MDSVILVTIVEVIERSVNRWVIVVISVELVTIVVWYGTSKKIEHIKFNFS